MHPYRYGPADAGKLTVKEALRIFKMFIDAIPPESQDVIRRLVEGAPKRSQGPPIDW